MSEYHSDTGTVLKVESSGKGFKSSLTFLATPRIPEETIAKRHRSWASVERLIKKYRLIEVS